MEKISLKGNLDKFSEASPWHLYSKGFICVEPSGYPGTCLELDLKACACRDSNYPG